MSGELGSSGVDKLREMLQKDTGPDLCAGGAVAANLPPPRLSVCLPLIRSALPEGPEMSSPALRSQNQSVSKRSQSSVLRPVLSGNELPFSPQQRQSRNVSPKGQVIEPCSDTDRAWHQLLS